MSREEMNRKNSEIDIDQIMDLYKVLGICGSQSRTFESIGDEYQQKMNEIKMESYSTSVFVNRKR